MATKHEDISSPACVLYTKICACMAGTNYIDMCETVILSKNGPATISQCLECKVLTLWMRSLLLNFSPEQFRSFKNFTAKLDIDKSLFPFPDGEERLVLRTPHNDICMVFSLDDWEQFQQAMHEAEYMMHIYEIIDENAGF